MIIGIDASRANHDKKTGVEWYAWHVIEQLKMIIPADVQVVLYSNEPLQGKLAELPDNWTQKVLKWPPRRLWTQLRLSIEMLLHKPDVLFTPAHVYPLIHPRRTVMTVHDVAALWFPQAFNWFERWYSVWTAKRAVRNLWRVIVPSEFTKEELAALLQKPVAHLDNVQSIYHGYDDRYTLIKDDARLQEVRDKYRLPEQFFLYLGRLEEKKNIANVVRAYSRFCDRRGEDTPHLVLAGKPGYGYETVERAIEESPCRDNIHTLGWVPTGDATLLMNAAHAFVFPTHYEGFGMPVLEAFASGTPVIASRGNSVEEVGEDAPAYVDPDSVHSIENAMMVLTDNHKLYKRKVHMGLARAQNFSWFTCACETWEVISGQ